MSPPLVLEVVGVIETGDDRAEWTFPAQPGAVGRARALVRARLADWGFDALSDLTALLVSELVTNSMRYASGPIVVRMIRLGSVGGLLVEVSDPLPEPPHERSAAPDEEGGRGLQLVARTARRWGIRRGDVGKTVWFELPLTG